MEVFCDQTIPLGRKSQDRGEKGGHGMEANKETEEKRDTRGGGGRGRGDVTTHVEGCTA